MQNVVKSINEIMGLEKSEIAGIVVDSVPDMAPVLGSILTNFKIRRLAKRLNTLESEIDQIKSRISGEVSPETVEHIKNFAFPIFLQKLLEEDEEQKIKYLVSSIQRIVNEQSLNESHLVLIFDILNELRCIEIDYLISLIENQPFLEKEKISQNVIKLIEVKLEKMGLIEMANSVRFVPAPEKETVAMAYHNETVITELGKEIINFIR